MGHLIQNQLDFNLGSNTSSIDTNPFHPHIIIKIDQATLVDGELGNPLWEIYTSDDAVVYSELGIPLITNDFCSQTADYGIYVASYNFTHCTAPLLAVYCIPKFENGEPVDVSKKFGVTIASMYGTFERHYNGCEREYTEYDVEIAFPLTADNVYNIPTRENNLGETAKNKNFTRYFVVTTQGENFQCDSYWWGGVDFYSSTDRRRFKILVDRQTNQIIGFKMSFIETD